MAPKLGEQELGNAGASVFRISGRDMSKWAREFETPLPIVEIVVEDVRLPRPDEVAVPALVRVFDRPGIHRLADAPRAVLPFAKVRHRGKTSMHPQFRQKSIRLGVLDEKQRPSRFDLCGFAPDDDFALIACAMDRSLVRDRVARELAAPLFPWVPRSRYVEVFLRRASDRLDEETYRGVYLASETASAGPGRIEAGDLEAVGEFRGLDGGGWAVRRDRAMPGRPGFTIGGEEYQLVSPGGREATAEALDWVRDDFARFRAKIREQATGEDLGEWLDLGTFVDMMLLQELVKNRDAFIFSAYYWRPAGGRMAAGPPWDYNLSMGNSEGFTGPEGLIVPGRELAGNLLRRPEIFGRFCGRWAELRKPGGAFSDGKIEEAVAAAAAEAGPGARRHFARHPELLHPRRKFVLNVNYGADTFEENVRIVREFLLRRARWMDGALGGMAGPDDLFSGEMASALAESEARGIGWWTGEEPPSAEEGMR